MATIRVERTARKRHRCERCIDPILPGERYIDARLPPGGELGNTSWWRAKAHTGCYAWAVRIEHGWTGGDD